MGTLDQRKKTFDEVAELYERVRPGYPERMIDDIVGWSAIPPEGRILEIGGGTGKASEYFARREFVMTCLEPGARLAEVARRKLERHPHVEIVVQPFEEWEPGGARFDLAFAAQSFHFIEPALGLAKIARVLQPGGAVAIFGNRPAPADSETYRRVQDVYARYAPELMAHRPDPVLLEDAIDATGLYGTVIMARYPWSAVYDAEDYSSLMATQSDHRLLPEPRRTALLTGIRDAIVASGGSVTLDYVTHLHLAMRRA